MHINWIGVVISYSLEEFRSVKKWHLNLRPNVPKDTYLSGGRIKALSALCELMGHFISSSKVSRSAQKEIATNICEIATNILCLHVHCGQFYPLLSCDHFCIFLQ